MISTSTFQSQNGLIRLNTGTPSHYNVTGFQSQNGLIRLNFVLLLFLQYLLFQSQNGLIRLRIPTRGIVVVFPISIPKWSY